jgi:hypothetical protein
MRLVAAVCTACALAALALPGVVARSADPDPEALLRQYQPVLYFHPEEDWAPEPVESFLSRARIERQVASGSWTGVAGPPPTSTRGCAFTPCYRFNLPCALKGGDACYERSAAVIPRDPVIYGRVLDVPAGTPPPAGFAEPTRYLVRYWVFYEFDDWRSPHERLWQAHEGDWETISIAISATGTPQFAAYSQHCSGTVRPWSGVTKRGGTHPVSYVALGSHANYFTKTTSSTKFSECLRKYLSRPELSTATRLIQIAQDRIVDRTGTARPLGPDDVSGVEPLELVALEPPLPAWARFPGRWSEGQLLWVGRVPRSFTSRREGLGPATPNWNATTVSSLWHVQSS